jgi:uncharacterized membrane protein YczE
MPLRLVQLFAGLVLYGVSSSMLLLAGLGVDPWDVLHQGLARRTGFPLRDGRRAFESASQPRPPGKTVLIVR